MVFDGFSIRRSNCVIMAPGSGFYTNPDDGRQQVRIAYILNKEDRAKAVVVLRKALEAYNAITE